MALPEQDSTTVVAASLIDPVAPALDRLLRQAVLDHITSERRRVFPTVLHVGVPGRGVVHLTLDEQRLDHALRVDVLEAMLREVAVATSRDAEADDPLVLVWLTRHGTLEAQDADVVWSSATSTAAAEMGRELSMVVVTRQGWRDPRSGVTHTWQRLRPPRT